MGQVKPLLSLDNEKQQTEVAEAIIEKGWSSRTVEDVVKELKCRPQGKSAEGNSYCAGQQNADKENKTAAKEDVYASDFQNRLVELLGTKVKVVPKTKSRVR